jgi:hypothetical protein
VLADPLLFMCLMYCRQWYYSASPLSLIFDKLIDTP